jgi:glycosyltransferase involved in cell wall biosynthesis
MKYGLPQFVFRDIQALTRKGHEVRLFTLHNTKGLYNPLPDWPVIPLSVVQALRHYLWFVLRHPLVYIALLKTAIKNRSLIDLFIAISFTDRMQDVDVIFSYFGDHKLFVGYYCKRITDIPLVVTVRAYELHMNPNTRMFIESLKYCDRIATITEYNKSILINKFRVPDNKIEIVRQIVDLDSYRFTPKIKILIVGFFAQKKGHDILFKAVKQLNRDDVELWVVGDVVSDHTRVDCRQLAKELGIESRIAFFGVQKDNALKALYRECDIFCLPSRTDCHGDHEGLPNAIIEAMAFSKPVISTKHAGIPEAIDHMLVDENHVEQLAEALRLACNSAALRRRLGGRNRSVAEHMFSHANNDKLEDILKQCARLTPSALKNQPSRKCTLKTVHDAIEA